MRTILKMSVGSQLLWSWSQARSCRNSEAKRPRNWGNRASD